MEKIFTDVSYVVCFKQITKYVIDYNLELLSVDLQKKKRCNRRTTRNNRRTIRTNKRKCCRTRRYIKKIIN